MGRPGGTTSKNTPSTSQNRKKKKIAKCPVLLGSGEASGMLLWFSYDGVCVCVCRFKEKK